MKKILLAISLLVSISMSQPLYLPVSHQAYSFLERMETKGLLQGYRNAVKPISRIQIAEYLRALDSLQAAMNQVEQEEFQFLRIEFNYELDKLAHVAAPQETRWHLWKQPLTGGNLNLDYDLKFSYETQRNLFTRTRRWAIRTSGYAYDGVGFYFRLNDNQESGSLLNRQRTHTPLPGQVLTKYTNNSFEYDEADAQLGFSLASIDFSIEKSKNVWGYGKSGTIILSEKAPSYPQIKMKAKLSDHIDFTYFHAELNSLEQDSSRSYFTVYTGSTYSALRRVDRSKYMAAHILEASLFDGVDIALGESIVYSDRGPLFIYLIPIMFFKGAEHYNRDTDNSQMFGSLDLNVVKNLNLHLSVFVDEIALSNFFDEYTSRKQAAITFGAQYINAYLDNLDILIEYTRLNPWVYSHKYTAANFTNNGFDLGHWVGQNGDLLYGEVTYKPLLNLSLNVFAQHYRKGGYGDIRNQYLADQGRLGFLYGPLHEEREYGLYGKYQPIRDLFLELSAKIVKVTDEQYPSLNRKNVPEFLLSAGVGLW